MAMISMLTTVDNPFDPFDDYSNWLREDIDLARRRGTITSFELLGMYALTSNDLSEADNHAAIEEAIDEIIKHDMLKLFKKVTKDVED